jgi:acyl dehydratase
MDAARSAGGPLDGRERFGRYLEELQVGDVYRHWPGKTVTQADNHLFCCLTMAVSPIHTDDHYAERHMDAGQSLVVGTYVYALLVGMSVPDTSGKALAALGTRELRHLAPVHHGDTLYAESTVTAARPSASRPDAGIVTLETRGTNQHESLVCTFERSFLVPRRP